MRFGLERERAPRRVEVLERLRALKRSIVVCACVALPLVLAGASLAGKTPPKKAPHRPPVRHSPKRVAGVAAKPKVPADHRPRQVPQALERRRAVRAAPRHAGAQHRRRRRGRPAPARREGRHEGRAVRQARRRRLRGAELPRRTRRAGRAERPAATRASRALSDDPRRGGMEIFPGSYTPLRRHRRSPIVDSGIDFTHHDLAGQAAGTGTPTACSGTCVTDRQHRAT